MESEPCEDPKHEFNSSAYHTGKKCVTPRCTNPAGTAWSPHWCQKCNAERLNRVSRQLEVIKAELTG